LRDKLTMNQGFIQTAAKNADGGNIKVTAPSYLYLVDSEISTSVGTGLGGGGNVTFQPKFVVQDKSPIIAEAHGGPGGNIQITTTSIYQFPQISESRISASSKLGQDGIVVINTPDNNADEGMLALSSSLLDVGALIDTPCRQKVAENLSSFVVVEREGAPKTYDDLLPSDPLLSLLPATNTQAIKTQVSTGSHVIKNFPKFNWLKGCKVVANM
jgi:large exoprotein involved in heme utilization and adhesion